MKNFTSPKQNLEIINESKFIIRIKNLFSSGVSYALMKIFARFYFIKNKISFRSACKSQENDLLKKSIDKDHAVYIVEGENIHDFVDDIRQFGFSTGIYLQNYFVDEVKKYAFNTPCYAFGDPNLGFFVDHLDKIQNSLGRDVLISKYFNLKDNKEIFGKFINSKTLHAIAKLYLGPSAKQIGTQLWWTFPVESDPQTKSKFAHYFHRDLDGWGFIKIFFYIYEVNALSGPHIYVKKSNKPSFFHQLRHEKFRIRRHSDADIIDVYGKESIIKITGKSGFGFAADTFGFHKGETPSKEPRLILCSVFATKDYGVQDFVCDPSEQQMIIN